MEIPFRISIFEEHCRAEEAVAQQILEQVKQKKNSVIGLATGRTMRGVYGFLLDEEKKEPGLFKGVTFVQLDEIIQKTVGEGIFSKELRELFIERLEGGYEAFLSINVFVEDMVKEATEYLKKVLNTGGIDLQLLGVGVNGHIGYNEPGSERQSSCRVVSLASTTIERDSLPIGSMGITLGVGDILNSKKIILLATGDSKAFAVRQALRSTPSVENPASFLVNHECISIILDNQAASML